MTVGEPKTPKLLEVGLAGMSDLVQKWRDVRFSVSHRYPDLRTASIATKHIRNMLGPHIVSSGSQSHLRPKGVSQFRTEPSPEQTLSFDFNDVSAACTVAELMGKKGTDIIMMPEKTEAPPVRIRYNDFVGG